MIKHSTIENKINLFNQAGVRKINCKIKYSTQFKISALTLQKVFIENEYIEQDLEIKEIVKLWKKEKHSIADIKMKPFFLDIKVEIKEFIVLKELYTTSCYSNKKIAIEFSIENFGEILIYLKNENENIIFDTNSVDSHKKLLKIIKKYI